jgi:hypothetical protein
MGKKVAFFGGVGSQPSSFSPGGSPFGRGGPGGGGNGINDFSGDVSLDQLISRANLPDILGFERPMESLLELFHENVESDATPYLLSFEERQQLNKKKKIRHKEHYLKTLREEGNNEDKIVKIVKKLKTIENLLEKVRKNQDVDFVKNASMDFDETPMDWQLDKLHTTKDDSYYRTQNSPPLLDQFLPSVDEYKDDGNPLSLTNARLTEPWTGQDPQYKPEDGVDKYVEELNNPYFPNMHNMSDSNLLINVTDPTQNNDHVNRSTPYNGSSTMTDEAQKPNMTMEEKLSKLKKNNPSIDRLDPDMFGAIDWDKMTKGNWKERTDANQTPYENDGLGGNLTNTQAIGEFTSNYPYNSAAGLLS